MPPANPKSSSGQEQQQTNQTFPNSSPYPRQFEDDTVDLYVLWITLWNWKWLVIAMTVVATLGSVFYALVTPLVYKAEARLLPPKTKNIPSMNVHVHGALKISNVNTEISPNAVFSKFVQNLNSRILHKKFIHENSLMELLSPDRTPETRDEDIYNGFAALINIKNVKGITFFSIELSDKEIAAQWVNDLIEFVDKETVHQLVQNERNSIANKIMEIEYTIASKREMAKQRREDQIIRYDEAAKIANNLGITRRVDATNIIQNTQMNVDIATATSPLYYLGFEALMTEISILQNRVSDDPFIKGLRDLQEKLALLRSINFNEEKMTAVHIDQAAYPSNIPIKPNRRLIVTLGTVTGLISGILLAFLIEFVNNQRKKHSV